MDTANPTPGRKRARLFSRDPLPGFVFSLDTNRRELRVESSNSCVSVLSASNQTTTTTDGVGSGSGPAAGVEKPSSRQRDTPSVPIQEALVGAEEVLAGVPVMPASPAPGGQGSVPATTAIAATEAGGLRSSRPSAAALATQAATTVSGTLEGATTAPSAVVIPSSEGATRSSSAQRVSAAAAAMVSAVPASRTGEEEVATAVDGDSRRAINTPKTAQVPAKSAGAEAAPARRRVLETPAGGGGGGGGSGGLALTGAASLVSSFLKRGSTASMSMPSPTDMPHIHGASPPTTPTSLASLVAGVPPGSGGSAAAGLRTPTAGTDNGTQTPRRGGDRFFHGAWPPSLKKRRRILYYPKPSDPVGMRILYWVRANYRVKDNLGLSVAFWLSAQTQLPLQAVTFVDPAIGRSLPSCNSASSSDEKPTRLPGARGAPHGAEWHQLPFGMAVEASALCEMEEALRALNVPLVAVACAESEIPSALACWCSGGTDSSSAAAAAALPPSAGSTVVGAAAAAATTEMLPTEGSVEITIMDECYHPRQLLLSEKVKDALRGTGALYAVDSSCVYPVNTNGGGAVGGQAGAGAGAGGATSVLSPEEFRRAQDGCLPAVLADLAPRPRLSLKGRLQNQMFTPGERRAILPRQFEHNAQPTAGSAFSVLYWSELREMSASRFLGFGKPISRQAEGFTQDLISLLGGGERVGEAALRQTLELITAYAPDGQRLRGSTREGEGHGDTGRAPPPGNCTVFENELAGLGFGGCLLHLLRLGSISSLSVVQALLCRPPDADSGDGGKKQHPKMCESRRHLLEQVLRREYALYRSHSYHRKVVGRVSGTAVTTRGSVSPPGARGQSWRGWMGIVPAWVWKELKKGQRDARQHQHSPGEMRSAGSTVPSSVDDEIFSAIQVRLTTGGRLHPSLASYWARAVVKMMLIPSQAVSLLVGMAEEFCLGAANAGDVVPELLDSAFGVLKLYPQTTAAAGTGACVPLPSTGQALETEEGLRSALGGTEALARFLSPLPVPVPPRRSPAGR